MTIEEAQQTLCEALPPGRTVTVIRNQRSRCSGGAGRIEHERSAEWLVTVSAEPCGTGVPPVHPAALVHATSATQDAPAPPSPGGYPCDCCGKQSWKLVSVSGSDQIVCRDCAGGLPLVNNYAAAQDDPSSLAAFGADLDEVVTRVLRWLRNPPAVKPPKQLSPSVLDLERSERKRDAS